MQEMSYTVLTLVLSTALATGVLVSALFYMWCHRLMYNWREFAVVGIMLVQTVGRQILGAPPESHLWGVTLTNLAFIGVILLISTRPHHIPLIERRRDCSIHRLFYRKRTAQTLDSDV